MKFIKIILIIAIALVILIVGVYAYYGGFEDVKITTSVQGGETMVYEDVIGDYSQTGEVSDKVYHSLLNDYQIETYRGFGIFYDNPQTSERSKMRSEVGCIIERADSSQLAQISATLKIKTAPEGNYVVAEFPFKGVMSVMLGIMKVYPAIDKYVAEHNIKTDGPVTEIYDIPAKKVVYRMLIAN